MEGYTSRNFGFDGNYNTLMPNADQATVRWDNNITQVFWDIINYGDNPNSQGNIRVIRSALARVILATAESIRFRKAINSIINYVPNESNWGFFHSFITRWNSMTEQAINYIEQYGTLNGFWASNIILMFTAGMDAHLHSCNRRNAGDLNNNEYCFTTPERVFHYDETNKKDKIIFHESQISDYANYYIHTFNLGKINPVESFTKIEFIGDVHSNCWGTRTEWSSWKYNNESGCDTTKIKGRSIKTYLEGNNNNLSYAITPGKITSNNSWNEIKNAAKVYLQDFTDEDGLAKIEVSQRFGLTHYFDEEDKNYYLQVICYQYLEWWASKATLTGKIKIGNGIRLYN